MIQTLVHKGIDTMGQAHVAFAQFLGCTFLSAILDNNIVADFASRGLHGLSPSVLHLFAMAQIWGTRWAAAGRTLDARNRLLLLRLSGAMWMKTIRRCSGSRTSRRSFLKLWLP